MRSSTLQVWNRSCGSGEVRRLAVQHHTETGSEESTRQIITHDATGSGWHSDLVLGHAGFRSTETLSGLWTWGVFVGPRAAYVFVYVCFYADDTFLCCGATKWRTCGHVDAWTHVWTCGRVWCRTHILMLFCCHSFWLQRPHRTSCPLLHHMTECNHVAVQKQQQHVCFKTLTAKTVRLLMRTFESTKSSLSHDWGTLKFHISNLSKVDWLITFPWNQQCDLDTKTTLSWSWTWSWRERSVAAGL